MAKIIPKLGLHGLTDNDLQTYAKDKIDKIGAEPAFAAINPTVGQLNTKYNQYRTALSATQDGNKSQTETKNERRQELEDLLTDMATDAAKIADGDVPLYLKTGFDRKDTQGTPVGELLPPENIKFDDYGSIPNELRPNWDVVEHAVCYQVDVYSDLNDPLTTRVGEDIVLPSKATITGLPGGQMVHVRVRAIGGSTGKSPWSDPAQKRVP